VVGHREVARIHLSSMPATGDGLAGSAAGGQGMTGQRFQLRRHLAGVFLGALVSLIVAGVVSAGPPAPPALVLSSPAADAVIAQNNSSIGCSPDANRGSGFSIAFSWVAPAIKTVKGYELILQHGTATPALDVRVTTAAYTFTACNAFVIDANLTGWHWQVKTLNNGKKVLATSEARPLSFAPCRLADGVTACHT